MPIAIAITMAADPAGASPGDAEGLTVEVAVGLGNATVLGRPDDGPHPGVAPLIGALGLPLGSRFGLTVRWASYLLPATVADRREAFVASFVGAGALVWPHRDLLLGAAVGPALVWPAPFGSSPYLRANRGLGLSLRAGWAVGRAAAGDLLLGAELLPAFFDRGDLLIGALVTAGLLWP
ncbi:MAG TPA: hypothetical protein VNO33_05035 [Kofleriaceae bacterium]|nr:hypothetical protein [Kofleriaceae bacterium]